MTTVRDIQKDLLLYLCHNIDGASLDNERLKSLADEVGVGPEQLRRLAGGKLKRPRARTLGLLNAKLEQLKKS